jgi:hypothetical protein
MDNTRPENLKNLKLEAEIFLRDNAATIQTLCAQLRSGRGSNMPGIGPPAQTKESAHAVASQSTLNGTDENAGSSLPRTP